MYPLCMEVCLLSIGADKVAINARLVNAIKFPLELEKVCLTKRPRLRHGQPVQLIANLNQTFVLLLESFGDLSFPIRLVSQMSVGLKYESYAPLQNNLSPPPTSLQQSFQRILTLKGCAIGADKLTVLQRSLDLLQLLSQACHFRWRELSLEVSTDVQTLI